MNLSSLNTKLATSAIYTSFQCYMHDRQNLLASHALTGYVLKMHNSPLYRPNKILVMNYPVNQETKSKIISSHVRTVTVMYWSFLLLINKTVAISFIVYNCNLNSFSAVYIAYWKIVVTHASNTESRCNTVN